MAYRQMQDDYKPQLAYNSLLSEILWQQQKLTLHILYMAKHSRGKTFTVTRKTTFHWKSLVD